MAKILLSCQGLTKGFGPHDLFSDVDYAVNEGDHIGLIGPNGAGKSTLLKIFANQMTADTGTVVRTQGLRLCYLDQAPQFDVEATVSQHLSDYLERYGGFSQTLIDKKISQALQQTELNDEPIKNLSGGQRKRLAIVSQWHCEPQVWLLDEPTNHLDFLGILWLQDLLSQSRLAFVVVSHDRFFLDKVAKRTTEINRVYVGGLLSFEGGYSDFMQKKAAYIETCLQDAKSLENKLRREDEWMSRQPKARSTKAQFRIDRVDELRRDLQNLKSRIATKEAHYRFSGGERKTKKLIELEDVTIGYSSPLAKKLNLILSPQKIIGIMGLNGTGKTTILRAILADEHILEGRILRAHDLKVVYFDQMRQGLDSQQSLKQALSTDGDSVIYNDKLLHINAWANMLGFDVDRLHTQVKDLSGGERARVLLSQLIRQKADVLLLDEPTNDLDIQSLELLEQSMQAFSGSVVLITHDRYLLSHVCDEILGFLPGQQARMFADYAQWEKEFLAARRSGKSGISDTSDASDKSQPKKDQLAKAGVNAPALNQQGASKKPKKRSYKDQREYEGMEATIAAAEGSLQTLKASLESGSVSDAKALSALYEQLHTDQERLDQLYERWAVLEAMVDVE